MILLEDKKKNKQYLIDEDYNVSPKNEKLAEIIDIMKSHHTPQEGFLTSNIVNYFNNFLTSDYNVLKFFDEEYDTSSEFSIY